MWRAGSGERPFLVSLQNLSKNRTAIAHGFIRIELIYTDFLTSDRFLV